MKNFRNTFLNYYVSQLLDIWYQASGWGAVPCKRFSGLSLFYFLFTDLVHILDIGVLMKNFRKTFLCYYESQLFDIWYQASGWGAVLCKRFSGLSLFNFLFTDLVHKLDRDINEKFS